MREVCFCRLLQAPWLEFSLRVNFIDQTLLLGSPILLKFQGGIANFSFYLKIVLVRIME
jgi:hypothetical protein